MRPLAIAIGLLVAASIAAFAIGGAAPTAVGYALAGFVAVLAITAAFYLVGRSEDRDREAREAAQRRADRPRPPRPPSRPRRGG